MNWCFGLYGRAKTRQIVFEGVEKQFKVEIWLQGAAKGAL
jgi:hypothetical protein